MDSYADCIIRYIGTSNAPICYISLTSASYSAETMVIGLTGAANPNSPTYIGDPPAELSMLVEETLARAGEAQQQWSEYDAANCTPNPETEVCKTERGNFVFVANMLNVTLDRWGPYL